MVKEGSRSLAQRMGTHLTIVCALVVTNMGTELTFSQGESASADVAQAAVHAVAIGAVVFLWLPLSVWLARSPGLSQIAAEGVVTIILGLIVAGVERWLLRGPDHLDQTVVAVSGMLVGWAMRIEPPQSSRDGDP